MNKNNKLALKGFTLAELLLAMSILVFALCAIVAGFISAILLIDSDRNLTVAATHAQFALEEIKNTNFISIANFTWNTTDLASHGLTALNNETIVAKVSGVEPLSINVTANWQDRALRNRTINLETLITEP